MIAASSSEDEFEDENVPGRTDALWHKSNDINNQVRLNRNTDFLPDYGFGSQQTNLDMRDNYRVETRSLLNANESPNNSTRSFNTYQDLGSVQPSMLGGKIYLPELASSVSQIHLNIDSSQEYYPTHMAEIIRDDPDGAGGRSSPLDSCWSSDQQMSCELDSGSTTSASFYHEGLGPSAYHHSNIYKSHILSTANRVNTPKNFNSGTGITPRILTPCNLVVSGTGSMNIPFKEAREDELSLINQSAANEVDVEEKYHKNHLQIYIFAARCIAYPFSVRPSDEPVRKYLKINKEYLGVIRERFQAFIRGELSIVCNEPFTNAVEHFYETFLKSDRVSNMVKSGGCSLHDFREVFVNMAKKKIKPSDYEPGMTQETILPSWKIKFDQICRGGEGPSPVATKLAVPQAELVNPTREQLYDMFMKILGIKKYEHQILFNTIQLDNIDEQAAQVRRELAQWTEHIETITRVSSIDILDKILSAFVKLRNKCHLF